jgi:hypothetical protein
VGRRPVEDASVLRMEVWISQLQEGNTGISVSSYGRLGSLTVEVRTAEAM